MNQKLEMRVMQQATLMHFDSAIYSLQDANVSPSGYL